LTVGIKKADGTGAEFDADTTVTGEETTVYAKWKFTPGVAKVVDGALVQEGITLEAGGSPQGGFSGTWNSDGSVTLKDGAFGFKFPEGWNEYDFITLDWVYNYEYDEPPQDMIFKQGLTGTDYPETQWQWQVRHRKQKIPH